MSQAKRYPPVFVGGFESYNFDESWFKISSYKIFKKIHFSV